jgi:transposase
MSDASWTTREHKTPESNKSDTKKPIRIAQKFRWFERALYRERYKVERTFGWQDTYRKLAVSYDRLPEIRKGCRLLAYAMINYRVTFSPF